MFPIIISSLLNAEGKGSKVIYPLKLVALLLVVVIFSFLWVGGKIFKTEKSNKLLSQITTSNTAYAQEGSGMCCSCGGYGSCAGGSGMCCSCGGYGASCAGNCASCSGGGGGTGPSGTLTTGTVMTAGDLSMGWESNVTDPTGYTHDSVFTIHNDSTGDTTYIAPGGTTPGGAAWTVPGTPGGGGGGGGCSACSCSCSCNCTPPSVDIEVK